MGAPTIFVRFAGCNLDCVWCDTKYAREEKGKELSISDILGLVEEEGWSQVCLTGGEPLCHEKLPDLVATLIEEGYGVVVETNGSMDISKLTGLDLGEDETGLMISMDVKCPSSSMDDKNNIANLQRIRPWDQVKFVVKDESDYQFALDFLDNNEIFCPVIFTPVGGVGLAWLAEKVLEDGLEVRVLPQLHKLIWGDERGR